MHIPRFDLQNESTLALRIGLGFFVFLAVLFLLGMWIALNPRDPRQMEVTRIFEHLREQNYPDMPIPPPPDPPKPDHILALRYLAGLVASVTAGILPVAMELRRRSRAEVPDADVVRN